MPGTVETLGTAFQSVSDGSIDGEIHRRAIHRRVGRRCATTATNGRDRRTHPGQQARLGGGPLPGISTRPVTHSLTMAADLGGKNLGTNPREPRAVIIHPLKQDPSRIPRHHELGSREYDLVHWVKTKVVAAVVHRRATTFVGKTVPFLL